MDITPKISNDKNLISSYGDKGFEIKEQYYQSVVILNSEELLELPQLDITKLLKEKAIIDFLSDKTELLLVGTGLKHQIINCDEIKHIKDKYPNLVINEMSSDGVCRTFNILITEDREVCAILLPVKS